MKKLELARIWYKAPVHHLAGDYCLACRRATETHEIEGVGMICKECFQKSRPCKREGCETRATSASNWECREHFVGSYDELHVDDFGGFKQSSVARCSDYGQKKLLTRDGRFLENVRDAMLRIGVPTKMKRKGKELIMERTES